MQDKRAELLRRAQEMGVELAEYRRRCVDMTIELEELRRIRHLARAYRLAEIECMSYFGSEPRMRSWHRRLELDRLLGIAEELQGLA